jgi:hypothetical protein
MAKSRTISTGVIKCVVPSDMGRRQTYMPDLETCILNRLQDTKNSGQTAEQLANHCGAGAVSEVVVALMNLERMGHVQVSGGQTTGVWALTGH